MFNYILEELVHRRALIKDNCHHKHICALFDKNNNLIVSAENVNKIKGSYHSEHNALEKLFRKTRNKGKNNRKRLIKITALILKVSSTGIKLGMSKPCIRCINNMSYLPQKYGYRIHDVIYSNKDGTLTYTTLNKLLQEGSYFTKYDVDHNYKSRVKNVAAI